MCSQRMETNNHTGILNPVHLRPNNTAAGARFFNTNGLAFPCWGFLDFLALELTDVKLVVETFQIQ